MNTLKLSLFPILFMYHLIQFSLTKRSIINSTKLTGTKTMTTIFNWIQQQPIPQLLKMEHGVYLQVLNKLNQLNDFEKEIAAAKLFYVQALRNQASTEKRFPQQREMIKQQADHLLQEYVRTQELLNLHLQAQINAGDINTFRNRLEATYVTMTAHPQRPIDRDNLKD